MVGHYDLEDRTLEFARQVIKFQRGLVKTLANTETSRQLIRSSGSVGANYIEANESLSKKDFVMRVKICRKEAKETVYWLKLLEIQSEAEEILRMKMIQEATELMKIFGAIIEKTK